MELRSPDTAEKTVQVFMLGGFRLQSGDKVITDEVNRSLKLWSVLCYLIVHRDRAVPQAELIDVFWSDENSANPLSALKVLLHRARTIIDPLFDDDLPPIISLRGAYQWNPAIACEVDTDRFEALCLQIQQWPDAAPGERTELYREAIALYKGDFLPKLGDQSWVIPLQAQYHNTYISAVKACARLLEDANLDLQMELLCSRAILMEPLDEGLHVLTVRAMMHQGKNAAALKVCEAFSERLYQELGIRPSDELKALQKQILAAEKNEKATETDLDALHDELRETFDDVQGAFVCDFDFFKAAYRLESRRAIRNGGCLHMGMITVSMSDGAIPPMKVLGAAMEQLQDVIVRSLRQGDVVAKYGSAQFVVMLPTANLEDSTIIMERILSTFYRRYRRSVLKLSYKLRELGIA